MGCGESLVKYILFFGNLFFALSGITLLALGVAVELKLTATGGDILNTHVGLAPISAIVLGSVVFVISFFGCCGAIRESNCMLVMYAIFMIILMVLKIVFATLIFVNMETLAAQIPQITQELYNKDKETFHGLESAFQCCGMSGASDYMPMALPASCCAADSCTLLNSYSGCNQVLTDFLKTFGHTLGIFALFVAAFELVAVVFGLCLANHVRNKERRGRY